MNKILVFAEAKENLYKSPAFEVVSAGKYLSEKLNCDFDVLTISKSSDDSIKTLGKYGAKKVFHLNTGELNALSNKTDLKYSHSAFSKAISKFAVNNGYDCVIMSGTSFGKELAPSVSIGMDAAIISDVVEFLIEGNDLSFKRPSYAGKVYTKVKSIADKFVITLRPNVFKPIVSEANVEIEKVDISSLGITEKDFSNYVSDISLTSGKLDVAEADIIVSGGRGLKEATNFHLVEELASSLGAATGASRAVVDAGWRPHSEQVGQTGKTVSPSLYIACGISGAIQHLAGMSSSKFIVAINKDPDAPIFQSADYGIVGDVFEILPAMTAEIKKLKE